MQSATVLTLMAQHTNDMQVHDERIYKAEDECQASGERPHAADCFGAAVTSSVRAVMVCVPVTQSRLLAQAGHLGIDPHVECRCLTCRCVKSARQWSFS